MEFQNHTVARPRALLLFIALMFSCGLHADEDASSTFTEQRHRMVEFQLKNRDIDNHRVLQAMTLVPRHEFVPSSYKDQAYGDWPLPIGYSQTISQPYIVAYMTQALNVLPGQKILEVGTGSGYQAAVLAQMGAHVYSIEIVPPLGERAKALLKKLGYSVHVKIGDGYDGWPEAAPFDGIMVTAAPIEIPVPLKQQLREGGRMVIPVGDHSQYLYVYVKTSRGLMLEKSLPVRFVPMTGKASHQ